MTTILTSLARWKATWKIRQHFFQTKRLEAQGSWWIYLGPITLSVYMLAGRWISCGIHLSVVPLYIDLHMLWFVISLMSTTRAKEIYDYEEAYLENE